MGEKTKKKDGKTPKPNQCDISSESGQETPKQHLHDHVIVFLAHGSWAGTPKTVCCSLQKWAGW
jgi:hypothetical protein